MGCRLKVLLLLYLCQLLIVMSSGQQSQCTVVGNCQFTADQGTIDLTPLDANPGPKFKDVSGGLYYSYSYNPCTPFSETLSSASPDNCKQIAVCQVSSYSVDTVGAFDGVQCIPGKNISVVYTGTDAYGSTVTSTVKLQCSDTDTFVVDDDSDTYNVKFSLKTRYACFGGASGGGLSGGSILCIVFTVVILVYLLAGSVYMYLAREARGVDMIPNRAFWKELPLLVKDGCMFIVQKVRGTAKSYDEI